MTKRNEIEKAKLDTILRGVRILEQEIDQLRRSRESLATVGGALIAQHKIAALSRAIASLCKLLPHNHPDPRSHTKTEPTPGLLPCHFPKCGSVLLRIGRVDSRRYVECLTCRSCGPLLDDEKSAANAWNALPRLHCSSEQ